MMMMAFHLLIQIISDFGLSFPIFLLLTILLHLLCSLLYLLCTLLCKTLAGWALASAMEDCAGLLGKIMNSELYWLLHLIDTLFAFVFSITSLISALVAVDVFVNVSTATAGQ